MTCTAVLERICGAVECERVASMEVLNEALGRASWDLLIADDRPGGCDAFAVLEAQRRSAPGLPVIVLTDCGNPGRVVELFRSGARDCRTPGDAGELAAAVKVIGCARLPPHWDLLQAIIEGTTDAVHVKDREGRYLMVNHSAAAVMGAPREEIIGRTDADLLPADIAEVIMAHDRRILSEGITETVEEDFAKLSPPRRFLTAKGPVRDAGGMVRGIYGIAHDITRRRSMEEDLRMLSRVVEQSPNIVVITDLEGRIQYVNPKFTEATGYSAQEAVGNKPSILKSGRTPPEVYTQLWKAITAGGEWHGEFMNRRKDGRFYWEAAHISAIKDDTGAITHYLGVKEVITERKRLEERLRQVQKMEAVGQLAGGIAHDFNNILTAIIMQMSFLMNLPDLRQDVRDGLEELQSHANRAAAMTRQLLLFGSRQPLQAGPMDLNETVSRLLNMLQRLLGENIRLYFRPGVGIASINADRTMMEQMVLNLCVNARDAMQPDGGRLMLATDIVEIDAGEAAAIPGCNPGAYIRLSVSDTGCGMEEATLKRLFEPFFSTKALGRGTGLGLSIVHGIVRQHNGWIDVESQPGSGTTFRVHIPVLGRNEAGGEAPSGPADLDGTETILLVEDDVGVRRTMSRCLQIHGYTVIEAADGPAAMAIWEGRRDEVDLLFTDMVMPGGMSGTDLARRLRQDRPGLRVVLSSGYSSRINEATLPKDSRMIFLPKPQPISSLLAALRALLDA